MMTNAKTTTEAVMDEFTIRHLDNWLNEQFREELERDEKRGIILAFVTEYPDLLERMSWWNFGSGRAEVVIRAPVS